VPPLAAVPWRGWNRKSDDVSPEGRRDTQTLGFLNLLISFGYRLSVRFLTDRVVTPIGEVRLGPDRFAHAADYQAPGSTVSVVAMAGAHRPCLPAIIGDGALSQRIWPRGLRRIDERRGPRAQVLYQPLDRSHPRFIAGRLDSVGHAVQNVV